MMFRFTSCYYLHWCWHLFSGLFHWRVGWTAGSPASWPPSRPTSGPLWRPRPCSGHSDSPRSRSGEISRLRFRWPDDNNNGIIITITGLLNEKLTRSNPWNNLQRLFSKGLFIMSIIIIDKCSWSRIPFLQQYEPFAFSRNYYIYERLYLFDCEN